MSVKLNPLWTKERTAFFFLIVIIVEVFIPSSMGVSVQTKYLVGVGTEVKVFHETGGKFTEQEIVCVIDGPQAPVCVVVGTGARTERTHYREREAEGEREGADLKNNSFSEKGRHNIAFISSAVTNSSRGRKRVPKHFLKSHLSFLTRPEGGGLPVMVVVGEAGQTRHAAGVVVLESLQEFAQFFSALLLLLQPLSLLLGRHSDGNKIYYSD